MPHGTDSTAKDLPPPVQMLLHQWLGSPYQTAPDAHPIHHQATVGGMMDCRLDNGAVHPQLASSGHTDLGCQLTHAIVERLDGCGPNGLRPAQQRGIVGHLLEIDPAEP